MAEQSAAADGTAILASRGMTALGAAAPLSYAVRQHRRRRCQGEGTGSLAS